MSNPQAQTIESLEKSRDAARETAAAHPHQAKVEALRDLVVKLKRAPSTSPVLESVVKGAALVGYKLERTSTNDSALTFLLRERETLKATQYADLEKAQAALTFARRGARAAADGRAAEEFASLTIEQLEAKRDELTVQRKGLKRQQRAVAIALSAKHEGAATKALLAKLSPEQIEALKKSLS